MISGRLQVYSAADLGPGVRCCRRAGARRLAGPAVLGPPKVLGNAYAAEVMSNESASIRIMSVDDHPLLRAGIAALVENIPDMRAIAEAANGREALTQFRAHRPDITLMDLEMPEIRGYGRALGWVFRPSIPVSDCPT